MTVELILPLFAVFSAASHRIRSPFSFGLMLVPLAAGMQGIRSSILVSGFPGQQAGATGPVPISPDLLATIAVTPSPAPPLNNPGTGNSAAGEMD